MTAARLTAEDTPTAEDVLRGHQWTADGHHACACGRTPLGDSDMAVHQLQALGASGLAVVSVYGTAAIVTAAAKLQAVLQPGTVAALSVAEARAVLELQEALLGTAG